MGRRDFKAFAVRGFWVGLGGFLGANLRYSMGVYVASATSFPWSTLIVNITGCLLLGFFITLMLHFTWNVRWQWGIAIGLIGGYTTFCTFAVEAVLLLESAPVEAAAYILGSLITGLIAVWIGVVLGRIVTEAHK